MVLERLEAILVLLFLRSLDPCATAAVTKYGPVLRTPPIILGMNPPLDARLRIFLTVAWDIKGCCRSRVDGYQDSAYRDRLF